MRRLLFGLSVGLGIVACLTPKGQAQHHGHAPASHGFGGGHGFGGHGFGGARPIPHSMPPHHPGNGFFPQPRPVSPGHVIHPAPRPRPVSPSHVIKPVIRPAPIGKGSAIKPTTRPKVRPSGSAVVTKPKPLGGSSGKGSSIKPKLGRGPTITKAKPSIRPGNKRGIVARKLSAGGKFGTHKALSKHDQLLILQAIKRLGHRIESALLLSALQNLGCGQPLSVAQAGCLGQFLNDPGCGLTTDEQGCIQQCLGGGESVVDASGEDGGEDTSGDSSAETGGEDNGTSESDDGGVLFQEVKDGGAAAEAGLRAGDVILSFDDMRTHTFEELQDAVAQASGPVKVVFINSENGQTEYVMVEPEDGRIGVTCE
jgi:hypothetical protein